VGILFAAAGRQDPPPRGKRGRPVIRSRDDMQAEGMREFETPRPSLNGQPKPGSYQFSPVTSAEFDAGDYRPEWLVKRLAVKNQPMIAGGPRKALKTTILIDLAISCGTGDAGSRFLRRPQAGQDGHHLRRIGRVGHPGHRPSHLPGQEHQAGRRGRAVGLPPATASQRRTPGRPEPRTEAETGSSSPSSTRFTCACSPAGWISTPANLFDMGPILLAASRACLDVGCTPALIHHSKKNLANAYEPLETRRPGVRGHSRVRASVAVAGPSEGLRTGDGPPQAVDGGRRVRGSWRLLGPGRGRGRPGRRFHRPEVGGRGPPGVRDSG